MFENLTACFIVNAYFFAQAVTFLLLFVCPVPGLCWLGLGFL